MNKIYFPFFLMFFCIYLQPNEDDNIKITIIPIYSTTNNIEKNYSEIIYENLKKACLQKKHEVFLTEAIDIKELNDIVKLSEIGKNNKSEIIIYGTYNIRKNKLSINLTSFDVNNKYKMYNKNIFINIQNKQFEKILTFNISNFIKDIINNYKIYSSEYFKKACDFSIGYAISPIIASSKFSYAKKIDMNNITSYQLKNNLNIKFIPAALSFSYSYYLTKRFSIGFNILNAYSSGVYIPDAENSRSHESTQTSPIYMHSIINSTSFRIKNKSNKKRTAFIWELGVFSDIEILNFISKYSTDEYALYINSSQRDFYNSYDCFEGNLFIGLGPVTAFGYESRNKNFTYEFLGFISAAFGWKSTDTLNVIDRLALNSNLQVGILIKFNYYKLHIIK